MQTRCDLTIESLISNVEFVQCSKVKDYNKFNEAYAKRFTMYRGHSNVKKGLHCIEDRAMSKKGLHCIEDTAMSMYQDV